MKKLLAIALIILSVAATFTNVFAAEVSSEEVAEVMESLGIMSGYPDGSLHLGDKLTRAQFAKIMINASAYRNTVSSKSTTSPFKDVKYSSWAAPYVSVAVTNGLIKGYPDATFKPDKNVTLEEAVTVALTLLGYTSDDFGSSWPYGQLSVAANIGLLKNVSASAGTEITRQDAMRMVYNMLNSNTKTGTSYIDSVGYSMLEDVILIATYEEDPTIGAGKVSTSQGTYRVSDTFNSDSVGKKGNAILNVNNEIICFMPSSQQVETYTAYAALENDIIVATSSGSTQSLGLGSGTTVYMDGAKTTVSAAVSDISVGDIVKVSRINGNIDFVVISGNTLVGPVIASGSDWVNLFSTDVSGATLLRNGNKAAVSDINTNDVLYYSSALNTIWAYNKKITGVYEDAYPNQDQPSKITISGIDYSIETAAAFNKLSSKGSFHIGDSVTLLLGKDGKIADVVSPTESKTEVVGYLTESGNKDITNSSGYTYSVNYIKMVTTDGDELEYEAYKDYSTKINSVVRVKFSNGLATITTLSSSSISGTFDWDAKKLGTAKLAADVKIMDVGALDSDITSQYVITYPQRLDNIKISSSDVLYYSKNTNGEINSLILENVTGDALSYGIVTAAQVTEGDSSTSSLYKCNIGGSTLTLSKSNGSYTSISAGDPAAFEVSGGAVISIKKLVELSSKVTDVNGVQLETSDGKTYLLSSEVVVYQKNYSGSGYKVLPLSDIIGSTSYSIKAYYDKAEISGGRIRVIVVTEN
ncbi:MAG: S-layer homology domain-containing protein [Sedimentibacter sp.]|uniref:S-layer homology domain-containing protein n=1 Tax=Sedimentibacter sp. TaxID=1960295 RepID=UPI003158E86D